MCVIVIAVLLLIDALILKAAASLDVNCVAPVVGHGKEAWWLQSYFPLLGEAPTQQRLGGKA